VPSEAVVEYVWFGEVILRCSPEFVEEDKGATLVAALLEEQLSEAHVGGVATPAPTLWNPTAELALYEGSA
jgi:hypothetical protein